MYLSLKEKKTPKEHNIFLLLSILAVTSSLYALLEGYKHITLSCVKQPIVKEKVLSLVINPAPVEKKKVIKKIVKQKVVKKEIPKPIKKEVVKKEIIKEKVVEKPVEQEVIEEVVEQEVVEEVIEQEVVEETVQEPVFDEKAKESFIAGLYELLNENKHYPKMAKRRKLEGVCEVSFTLNKDGRLKNVFLKDGCGHSILDKAALKVVSSIEFYKPIPDSVSLTSLHLNIPIKYARN